MIIAAPGPSSRLYAPVARLIGEMFPDLGREHSRALWHRSTEHTIVLCRGFDVPKLVAAGIADLGICGYDVCVEWSLAQAQSLSIWAMPPVRTSFVAFCTVNGRAVQTIWTEYPAITTAWLAVHPSLRTARTATLHGATEGVIRADPHGGGVLLVTSGETLRANGLDHEMPLLATDVCVVARSPDVGRCGQLDVSTMPPLSLPSFSGSAMLAADRPARC